MSPSQSPGNPMAGNLFTSKIIEWDDAKGFGYLLHRERKLFLHRKDFAERHKRPGKGDRVHYKLGTDPKGRKCAVEAVHVNDGGKLTFFTWIGLMLLLSIPALAINKYIVVTTLPSWFIIVPLVLINYLTYTTYKSDKAKAKKKVWRTSEGTLHLLGLLGGWPAAFIAQRQFRHKCSKPDFLAMYWMTVCMFSYLSIDYILGWRIIKAVFTEVS
jgi:uncharacterized membrane protein YsdA (DUF1294 family)/cold shock CspA family protein